ncbi:MAG: tail fiber protein, partial [Bradyrhizobium sp.]|nr:tail fiber protein [Bradyrhizobium sp.]
MEGFRIAWVDEAQTLSARSLSLLRPTIRAEASELWASWNPYNVPLGAGLDYWGAVVPNSSFAFPAGQAISRTTYATLFAIMGTTYGTGDGSTTFNLPDKTGRVSAMQEASAARLTSTYFGGNSTILGSVGGGESETLVSGNIPQIPLSVSGSVTGNFGVQLPTTGGTWNINASVQGVTGSNGVFPQATAPVGNVNNLTS